MGNHRLSASRQAAHVAIQSPSVKRLPETTVENTPKTGVSGTQGLQSPQERLPDKQPKPTKPQGKTSVKGHGDVPKNNVSGNSNVIGKDNQNSPAAPIQINSAPNGIAIGGGTVVNPTVNNNYAVQTKPDRTITDADRINIVTYLSQIKATVSLKALSPR